MKRDNCKNCQNRYCEHFGKDREFVCINGISCKMEKIDKEETKMTYLEQVKADVRTWINDNMTDEEVIERMEDREDFAEWLDGKLWIDDSVTGNASGSYTFSTAKAKEYVLGDIETVLEAVREFCAGMDAAELLQKLFNEEWEYFDVTTRCYVLGIAISGALDEIGDTIPGPDGPSDNVDEYIA